MRMSDNWSWMLTLAYFGASLSVANGKGQMVSPGNCCSYFCWVLKVNVVFPSRYLLRDMTHCQTNTKTKKRISAVLTGELYVQKRD